MLNGAPSISLVTRSEIMSSRGFARRSAKTSTKYCCISPALLAHSIFLSSDKSSTRVADADSDHYFHLYRWLRGAQRWRSETRSAWEEGVGRDSVRGWA